MNPSRKTRTRIDENNTAYIDNNIGSEQFIFPLMATTPCTPLIIPNCTYHTVRHRHVSVLILGNDFCESFKEKQEQDQYQKDETQSSLIKQEKEQKKNTNLIHEEKSRPGAPEKRTPLVKAVY